MRYCERRDAVRGDSEGGGGEGVRGAERRDTGAAAARGGGGLVPVLLPLLEVEERVLPAAWFRVGARAQAQAQAQWFWLGLGLERGEALTVGHLKRRLVDGRTAPRPLARTHKHGGARRDAARIVRERRCAHAVLGGYPATAALGLLAACAQYREPRANCFSFLASAGAAGATASDCHFAPLGAPEGAIDV